MTDFARSQHVEEISFSAFECCFCQEKNWIDGELSTSEAVADTEAIKCWNCGKASFILPQDCIESDNLDPEESAGLQPGRKNVTCDIW